MDRYPKFVTSRELRNDIGQRKTELTVVTNDGRMYVGLLDYLKGNSIEQVVPPTIKWVRVPDLPQQ